MREDLLWNGKHSRWLSLQHGPALCEPFVMPPHAGGTATQRMAVFISGAR